ncbi:MAG: A/G-specific adenine glycosylase [Candidatus Thorarchaeota archaeon]
MSNDTRKHVHVRKKVIEWYEQSGRRFPWRETTDPYQILIAEILLRRTTAAAVSRVYPEFLRKFDSPDRLDKSRESTIAKALASLGLQELRARQLKRTATIIMKDYDGTIPKSNEELQSLPGIGLYIASAVRNFAFGEPAPLLDGNVIHFVSRVFGVQFTGPNDAKAWEFVNKFGGPHQPEFYWGIIDLVATVCLRQNPRCSICPVSGKCNWFVSH